MVTAQTIEYDVEEALKVLQTISPALGAVPGIGPLMPFISTLLPVAIQAVDTVVKTTGGPATGNVASAVTAVVNHLTPGAPNSPALS